jgi:hypothetical protein
MAGPKLGDVLYEPVVTRDADGFRESSSIDELIDDLDWWG